MVVIKISVPRLDASSWDLRSSPPPRKGNCASLCLEASEENDSFPQGTLA